MKYIDIHTHTYYKHNDVTILQNVFPAQADQLGKGAYYSIGLHPWHLQDRNIENDIEWINRNSLRNDVIAIGETGLDKTIYTSLEEQSQVFEKHLAIAAQAGKPVILHCVRSYSEMLEYRKKSDRGIPWIFHWFNASIQTAEQLTGKNCYLSFGHMLFNEKSKAYRTFMTMDLFHVFFETDDSCYDIFQVYEKAAEIKKIKVQELLSIISDNFAHCFKI
jgi:TatD DNase family protein